MAAMHRSISGGAGSGRVRLWPRIAARPAMACLGAGRGDWQGVASRRPSRWLSIGVTCLSALLPWSIAACAELNPFGGPATVASPAAGSAPTAEAPAADKAIAAAIEKQLASGEQVVGGGWSTPVDSFATFYQSRAYEPVWVTAGGLSARGAALVTDLKKVDRDGFNPRLYIADPLPGPGSSAADLAKGELELSAGLVRFDTDARNGVSPPRRGDPDVAATEKVIDPTSVLLSGASAPDLAAFLDQLPPNDAIYHGLREALGRYRALERSGVWQPLTATMALQPGASNDNVRHFRESLVLMGDLPADADAHSTHFDASVTAAVSRFQRRHALPVTGVVDAATRTAYNVPPSARVRQILVNMERRRWMPTDLGESHIFVNLANYSLDVMEDGKSVLQMRVVVGKPTWPTPVFSDMMEYLEFNPYWTVPPGILKKEVLPKMRSNPGYASSAGLKVYQNGRPVDPSAIDWSTVAGGYSFRQDPGERNALGRIKFMFPNSYSVYLHDTPSRALFARSTRAFSHGCVRVEKPMDLATYLLARNGDGWNEDRIDRTIDSGKNSSIRLKDPIQVHLAYLTVWLGSDGSVQFRNDIYGRDTTLDRVLSASAG